MTQNDCARVPVTMLSGFLGAGKTTLLRHLLQNTSGLKIGCIINDVAGVNVDAKLVRNDRSRGGPAKTDTTADLTDTLELANGCACCSIQDELFGAFEHLVALSDRRGTPFDRIILENSGVAEPHNIRELFSEAEAARHPLLSRVRLDTMVTVVDALTFGADYQSRTPLLARPDLGEGGQLRPVVDLLVEQIECADTVILNKADRLDHENMQQLMEVVTSLNPLATVGALNSQLPGFVNPTPGSTLVISCEHGRVDIERVFGGGTRGVVARLNVEGHHRGAVAAVSDRQHTSAASRFGIRSFLYCRRRPFHPMRLRDMVLAWLPVSKNEALGDAMPQAGPSPISTVLRSKGFMWTSTSHLTAFFWSHAGDHFEIRDEGDWWEAVPPSDWPTAPALRDIIMHDYDFSTVWGDRRQEIVFIGAGMDEAAISALLDAALLDDDEMKQYAAIYGGKMWSSKVMELVGGAKRVCPV